MDKNESNGIGILGTLTLIFTVLKLVGVIDWSWWWVLSPSLLAIALTIIVYTVCCIVCGKETK